MRQRLERRIAFFPKPGKRIRIYFVVGEYFERCIYFGERSSDTRFPLHKGHPFFFVLALPQSGLAGFGLRLRKQRLQRAIQLLP